MALAARISSMAADLVFSAAEDQEAGWEVYGAMVS